MLGFMAVLTSIVTLGVAVPTAPDESPRLIFARTFDEAEPLAGSNAAGGGVAVVAGQGHQGSAALQVEQPESEGIGTTAVRWKLPVESLRGHRVRVDALVKAEGLAKPPQSWNGIKVMLHIPGAVNAWPQAAVETGSFDWVQARFTCMVPTETPSAELTLGLEATTGRVLFDDIRITVLPPRRGVAGGENRGELDWRHGPGRLRGVMIGTSVDEDDLRHLAQVYGANHVRWQLLWGGFPTGPADTASDEEYDAWIDSEIARLVRLLPVCREAGIQVLIDLHTPPGGRYKGGRDIMTVFRDPKQQEHFLQVWERIVTQFKDEPAVWGYDLLNEPVVGALPTGLLDWPELALEAAKRIRAIDPTHAIIVEPAPWGSPDGLDDFEPLPEIDGVIYSVHMYQPMKFTHQGVYDDPVGVVYPGEIDGKRWDKAALREALEPARRFEQTFHVPIYIGEFSAIRWAPGTSGEEWLRDVIDIMEEYGWDWAYHAYREWQGWSFEHSSDKDDSAPSSTLTRRGELLRSYFSQNRVEPSR